MPVPPDMQRSYLARQLGSLVFSPVVVANPMAVVRAAGWHNLMLRVGVQLPLVVVHDIGLLLSGQGQLRGPPLRAGDFGGDRALMERYAGLLREVGDSELARAAASLRLRDDLVAVLLLRLLKEIHQRWPARRQWVGGGDMPLDPGVYLNIDPPALQRPFDAEPVLSLLGHLVESRLYLLTAVEQVDLDTLRLLGLFHGGQTLGGVVDMADLINVFASPEANGVVNFSMELLPSVLETRRQSGVQTFSIDGYASIERRGSVDSVVLSELAYDDDIFEQKLLDDELYYYGHEKQRLEERRLHYVLVDSSASMRGEREVFARGLALTLCKKLALLGSDVWLRFFDSRLYEVQRLSGAAAEAAVPYLLCFRSERGRNYARVFRQLLGELQRFQRQDERDLLLYVITHGQCHIGIDIVQQLALVAHLYGVFILPSSSLHLDYLPLMHRYQIVDADTLRTRERSVDRALEIVDDATVTRGGEGGERAQRTRVGSGSAQ